MFTYRKWIVVTIVMLIILCQSIWLWKLCNSVTRLQSLENTNKRDELIAIIDQLKVTYGYSVWTMMSGVYLDQFSGNYFFLGGRKEGNESKMTCILEKSFMAHKFLDFPRLSLDNLNHSMVSDLVTLCSDEIQSKLIQKKSQSLHSLLVMYSHNHLADTIQLLQVLRGFPNTIDILFLDNYSTDGTPAYLVKNGYAVLFQNISLSTWVNDALRIAFSMGYKKAIFMHTGIILTVSALDLIITSLENEIIVFPVMSTGPASQNLMTVYKLRDIYSDYVNDPYNINLIQHSLVYRLGSNPSLMDLHSNQTSFSFFGINLTGLRQSSLTIENLKENIPLLRPKLCLNCFVFNPVKGGESRSGIYKDSRASPFYDVYPQSRFEIVVGCAISNPVHNPAAGDIFTAKEFASALSATYSVSIRYLFKDTSWYQVEGLDILVVFLDGYSLPKMVNPDPGLITIAWMRNWFDRWLELKWIGNYDILLASSNVVTQLFSSFQDYPTLCFQKCPPLLQNPRTPLHVKTLRIATNETIFSPRSKDTEFKLDYVFTGNYWNSQREIMEFDPLNLSEFRGAVYGKGWKNAPVSEAWKKMIRGGVSYSKLPEIYQSTKIVIDDSNHVTKPWGSLNSRVFDALACGTLVITNGYIGSLDTFNLELPTYAGIAGPMDVLIDYLQTLDLQSRLRYYLTHDRERFALVKRLQKQVIQSHTYGHRAREFGNIVNSLIGSNFLRTRNKTQVWSSRSKTDCVCVGVRSYSGQTLRLIEVPNSILKELVKILSGLLVQSHRSQHTNRPQLKIYLVNTEAHSNSYESQLLTLVNTLNEQYQDRVKFLRSKSTLLFNNTFFGDDETVKLLDYLLLQKECEWIMLTNGDNMFHEKWFDTIAPFALNASLDIIVWNFTSHHVRNQAGYQPITVEIKRKFTDLGSAMIRREGLMGHQFQFSRDYFMIQEVFDTWKANKSSSISNY